MRRRRPLSRAAVLGLLVFYVPVSADTWITAAESQMYCSRSATNAERDALGIALGRADAAYWATPSRNRSERLQKYLLMLGMLAHAADLTNDQALRQQATFLAMQTSLAEKAVNPPAMRQVYLCAHAALMSAAVEIDDVDWQRTIAEHMFAVYGEAPIGPAIEDLPLFQTLREAALGERTEAIVHLAALAYLRAGKVKDEEPARAMRLMSWSAQGFMSQGDTSRAFHIAKESNLLMTAIDAEAKPGIAWSNFPALYDSVTAEHGSAAGAQLGNALLQYFARPPDTLDAETLFAVYARLHTIAAEGLEDSDQAGMDWFVETRKRAHDAILDYSVSVPMLRAGLDVLAEDFGGSVAQDYVWQHARDEARKAYQEAYRPMFAAYLRQAQEMPLSDIRATLNQQWKLEDWLETMSRLYAALPGDRADIVDLAFQGLQVHSYSSISAGAMQGYVRRSTGDAETRKDIMRFVAMRADPSLALRNVLRDVYAAGYDSPTADDVLKRSFAGLDISYNESRNSAKNFRMFVWNNAPDLRALLLGGPGPVAGAQSFLADDEGIVAFLPTHSATVIFAVTRTAAVLARSDLSRAQARALVTRLRASVLPQVSTGAIRVKPFDADAAFELYAKTVAPIRDVIADKKHLFWFAGAELASVPPSLLVEEKPAHALSEDPHELARMPWFADRHAVSVLPDAHLFWGYRGAREPPPHDLLFAGIGAPQLSAAELAGARQSRSTELAGGLNSQALATLPRLPEAADELRRLASLYGTERSVLLLGADASKPNVAALLARGSEVVSFATHGFTANEITGVPDPSLLLAGSTEDADPLNSLLTTREIVGFDFEARLVILSACSTATSDGRPRAASFTGLSQSFMSAGARALLVSHWPVASMAANELAVGTVERSRNDAQPLASALQVSMRNFRTTFPDLAHPFYWAPFVLVGDGQRSLH